jgi:hypothetical protein
MTCVHQANTGGKRWVNPLKKNCYNNSDKNKIPPVHLYLKLIKQATNRCIGQGLQCNGTHPELLVHLVLRLHAAY